MRLEKYRVRWSYLFISANKVPTRIFVPKREKEIGRLGNFHNENTQICVLVGKYYLGIQTKDEIYMGGTWSTHPRHKECMCISFTGKSCRWQKTSTHIQRTMSIGFDCLRKGSTGDVSTMRQWSFRRHKRKERTAAITWSLEPDQLKS